MPGFFSQGLSSCHRPSGKKSNRTLGYMVGHGHSRIRQGRQQHISSSSSSSYGDSSSSSRSSRSRNRSRSEISSTQQQRCHGSLLAKTRVAGTMDLLALVPPSVVSTNERQNHGNNNSNNSVPRHWNDSNKKNPKTLESSVSSLTADTAKTSSLASTSACTFATAATTTTTTTTIPSKWWLSPSPDFTYNRNDHDDRDDETLRDDGRHRSYHVRELSNDWGYFVDCTNP